MRQRDRDRSTLRTNIRGELFRVLRERPEGATRSAEIVASLLVKLRRRARYRPNKNKNTIPTPRSHKSPKKNVRAFLRARDNLRQSSLSM